MTHGTPSQVSNPSSTTKAKANAGVRITYPMKAPPKPLNFKEALNDLPNLEAHVRKLEQDIYVITRERDRLTMDMNGASANIDNLEAELAASRNECARLLEQNEFLVEIFDGAMGFYVNAYMNHPLPEHRRGQFEFIQNKIRRAGSIPRNSPLANVFKAPGQEHELGPLDRYFLGFGDMRDFRFNPHMHEDIIVAFNSLTHALKIPHHTTGFRAELHRFRQAVMNEIDFRFQKTYALQTYVRGPYQMVNAKQLLAAVTEHQVKDLFNKHMVNILNINVNIIDVVEYLRHPELARGPDSRPHVTVFSHLGELQLYNQSTDRYLPARYVRSTPLEPLFRQMVDYGHVDEEPRGRTRTRATPSYQAAQQMLRDQQERLRNQQLEQQQQQNALQQRYPQRPQRPPRPTESGTPF